MLVIFFKFFLYSQIISYSPDFNGSYFYCATAYWSDHAGMRVDFSGLTKNVDNIPTGAARACYKNSKLVVGWSQLEVETQAGYSDKIQAFAAGMLEGTLTWAAIYDQWTK